MFSVHPNKNKITQMQHWKEQFVISRCESGQKPTDVSKGFLFFFLLLVMLDSGWNIMSAAESRSNQNKGVLATIIIVSWVGFAGYVWFYQKCKPWTGFIWFFASLMVAFVLQMTAIEDEPPEHS